MFWIYLFFGLLAAIACWLFWSPVVAVVNTDRGELRVRWTPLLWARYPLPGGSRPSQFHLAGIELRSPRLRRKPRPGKVRKKKPRRAPQLPRILRFLRYCAADAYLRRAVVVAGGKLARGSLHSFGLARWHAEVSFPDPALNGMLFGWIAATRSTAATRWRGTSPVGVNFLGRNWLELELRFYFYRMAFAGGAFLFRLPHRAILGHWLASKTS